MMRCTTPLLFLVTVCLLALPGLSFGQSNSERIRVILDTEASNELDENRQFASLPRDARRIQPWSQDRRYWQYKGRPILLLGGTDQDNLFNHPNIGPDGLKAHLDLLVSVGGNYVRNTMSSRDRIDPDSDLYNDINRYPFHRDPQSGLYDLDRWDDTYWKQFRDFLEMTARRDIIVQIEIWDRWDYGEVWGGAYVAEACWDKQEAPGTAF